MKRPTGSFAFLLVPAGRTTFKVRQFSLKVAGPWSAVFWSKSETVLYQNPKAVTHSIANTRVTILLDLEGVECLVQTLRVLETKLTDRRLSEWNAQEEILVVPRQISSFESTVLDFDGRCLLRNNTLNQKSGRGDEA